MTDHEHDSTARRPRWLWPAAAFATLFGIATIIAGGRVVFGSAAARAAEGDYVPFVLWFNFLAGFAYVGAGIALALAKPWGARLALALAVGTALVYAAFGAHVVLGGAFTRHTAVAMALRTVTWGVIATLACRHFGCRRAKRTILGTISLAIVLVSATTCGRPEATVTVHAAPAARPPAKTSTAKPSSTSPSATTTQRTPAPRMSVKDHKGRALELPVAGRITLLSFASRQTADRGSERCREVRVAHPDVEIVEMMNVSNAPSFLAGKVKSKLAERHETIVADTKHAFTAAKKQPPADLDARIHIVADWTGDAFKAYGATNTDNELQVAVIDPNGDIVELLAKTPTAAQIGAAIARAGAGSTQAK